MNTPSVHASPFQRARRVIELLLLHALAMYGAVTLLDELLAPLLQWRPVSIPNRMIVAVTYALLLLARRGDRLFVSRPAT